MRIATWNVNSLRVRQPHVRAWWQAWQPDVLALQETKLEDAAFAALDTHFAPYAAHWGQKSYNGVALLAQHPLEDVLPGFNGHDPFGQARVLAATVQGVRVVSVYATNGESLTSEKFGKKRAFYAHLTHYVQALVASGQPVVVTGDFNIAADERDVDDPAKRGADVLFTPEERGWLQTLLAAGLVDALRVVSDEAGVFSWWDYRAGAVQRNRGMRIDYALVSHNLVPRIKAVHHDKAERLKEQPSDHIPVVLDLA